VRVVISLAELRPFEVNRVLLELVAKSDPAPTIEAAECEKPLS
jgi:hypothetical protein